MNLRAQQDARPWEERDGRGLLLDEDAGCFSCLPAFLRGQTGDTQPMTPHSPQGRSCLRDGRAQAHLCPRGKCFVSLPMGKTDELGEPEANTLPF